MKHLLSLAASITALLALCFTPALHAQTWPSKPVRIVVPFPPGGTSDIVARIVSEKLTALWGQPVVQDYKPGAGGLIATSEMLKSSGGHTLMIGTLGTHAIAPSLYKPLPYDPARDLVPVAMLIQTPMVLVASPTLPIQNLAEFVTLARANPGKYSVASPGNGTLNHLMAEMFKRAAKLDMEHIPYKGGTYVDLIAGRTALLFDPIAQVLPQIKQGNMKALAISQRSQALPGVPTMAEAGYPNFDTSLWVGLFAPAGTPAAVVEKISDDVVKLMKSPDVLQKVDTLSSEVVAMPHEAFAKLYQADLARWKKVIGELQLKVE